MAGIVTFNVSKLRTDKQKELLKTLNDDKVKIKVNTYIAKAMNEFVPKKSGALRRSVKVTPDSISWTAPYAHYQWKGEVWGPNFPIIGLKENGSIGVLDWRSKSPKHPTGRKLGQPGTWNPEKEDWNHDEVLLDYVFGYTTPETLDHWNEQYTGELKAITDQKITDYLGKELAKRKIGGKVSGLINSVRGFFK